MSEQPTPKGNVTVGIPEPFAGLVRRVGWRGIAFIFALSHLLNWSLNDALGVLGIPAIFPEDEEEDAEQLCEKLIEATDATVAYTQITATRDAAEHQAILTRLDLIHAKCSP